MFAGIPRGAWWVAAASAAVLAAARLYGPPHREPVSDSGWMVPLATPPGITLQLRTNPKRARVAAEAEWVYADANGMSLYSNDEVNARGISSCADDCAAAWPAATAPPASTPVGDWSLLERVDGTRQWVHQGAPLYRFGNEHAIGDAAGDGSGGDVWHVAAFRPDAGLQVPAGIGIHEIADAGGAGLVDPAGMTLYTLSAGAAPAGRWIALEAPQIANAVGSFAAIARIDGVMQWTYRGRPLYTFDGDRIPGEAGGVGAGATVALVMRFFMPPDATFHRTLELGVILATRSGATLYQRDRVATGAELHPFRTDHGPPALGRSFGTATCDANCAKSRPPFGAPPHALPSGYWAILTRTDGTRQWAYKGFALYTYAADKPGEFKGNAQYALDPIGDEKTRVDPPVPPSSPGIGIGAMFWHAVVP